MSLNSYQQGKVQKHCNLCIELGLESEIKIYWKDGANFSFAGTCHSRSIICGLFSSEKVIHGPFELKYSNHKIDTFTNIELLHRNIHSTEKLYENWSCSNMSNGNQLKI